MARPRQPLAAYLADRRAKLDSLSDPVQRATVTYKVRKRCKAEGVPIPEWAAAAERAPAPVSIAAPTSAAPATPREVPEALRAWISRGVSRCVQLSGSNVVLHEYGERPRKYPNVAAAIAAVAP